MRMLAATSGVRLFALAIVDLDDSLRCYEPPRIMEELRQLLAIKGCIGISTKGMLGTLH